MKCAYLILAEASVVQITIGSAQANDAQPIASLHAATFDPAWDAATIGNMLASRTSAALIARRADNGDICGFILAQIVVDEAEIFSIAVAPASRRNGLGANLISTLARHAREAGASCLFLEVASDNDAALKLYRKLGFAEIGRRNCYYQRSDGRVADALCLKLELNNEA